MVAALRNLLTRRRLVTKRLGLRARVATAFAFGALVLSVLLATVTYGLVRENLVRQRESTVTSQAYLSAAVVRDQLRSPNVAEQQVIDSLLNPSGGSAVLFRRQAWFAVDPTKRGREQLPAELKARVIDMAQPARVVFSLDGDAHIAIGVPIPAVDAAYFEITSLQELESTLNSLSISLVAAAVVTTLAGAALGAAVARRVLRPLSHVSAAAVAIAGGRLDTRVAQIDDPDLGTLVASFNEMAGALQERIERDARFASDVSHELRSPLTTLAASVEVLQSRRHEMPERSRAALDLLAADVHRFTSLVEDLLEISRFDAGAASLELEEVRISELVLHAVHSNTTRDIPVAIAADAAGCIVEVDKRRVVRVIANLLSNADRYGDGAVLVSVERRDDDIRVAVEDNGPGVPPADRERIFERFSRGSGEAGRRGWGDGVGLGLSLVREHVNLHGGRVWVEDRRNDSVGARFVVELPVVSPAAEAPTADLGPAAVPADEIVVVEDVQAW